MHLKIILKYIIYEVVIDVLFNTLKRNLATLRQLDYDLFIFAIRSNNMKLVKKLIRDGIDVTTNNNYAIRVASIRDHLNVVELLLKHGAKLPE